jgi:hypothetical protein
MHVRDARIDAGRLQILLNCFDRCAAVLEDDTEIEARGRMSRLQLQRPPIESFGFIERFSNVL